jgi:hypothetical protein
MTCLEERAYYIRDADYGVYATCFLVGCVSLNSDKIHTEWRKRHLTLEETCETSSGKWLCTSVCNIMASHPRRQRLPATVLLSGL